MDLKAALKSMKEEFDAMRVKLELSNGKLRDREQDLDHLKKQYKELERTNRQRSREASTRRRENEDLKSQLDQY